MFARAFSRLTSSFAVAVHQEPSHTSFRVGPAVFTADKSFAQLEIRRKITHVNGHNLGDDYVRERDEKAAEHERRERGHHPDKPDINTPVDPQKNRPEKVQPQTEPIAIPDPTVDPAQPDAPARRPFWETPPDIEDASAADVVIAPAVGRISVVAPAPTKPLSKQAEAKRARAAEAAEKARAAIVAKHKPKPKPAHETVFGVALKSTRLAKWAHRLGAHILDEGWLINAPVMA